LIGNREPVWPHEIDQSTVPTELRVIQRGRNSSHYEILPKPGTNLMPAGFRAFVPESVLAAGLSSKLAMHKALKKLGQPWKTSSRTFTDRQRLTSADLIYGFTEHLAAAAPLPSSTRQQTNSFEQCWTSWNAG
jgi:hypothetical protein